MSKQGFQKFITPKVSGAKKKEQIKQEKRKIKKEREAFFEKNKA
jgi:23S rRNA pseudouridine2605 synthase